MCVCVYARPCVYMCMVPYMCLFTEIKKISSREQWFLMTLFIRIHVIEQSNKLLGRSNFEFDL